MKLRDIFVGTLQTLWAHKLRAGLTMFGIAWGVISITLMVGAGEGLRVGQKQQTENLGKDLMIVFAGRTSLQAGGARAGRAMHWSDTDHIELAKEAVSCRYILPELSRGDTPIRSATNNASLQVSGSLPDFASVRSIPVGEGRFYNQDDLDEARRVAFIGSDVRKQLFKSGPVLGQTINVGDFPYTVIGVMQFKEQDSSYDGRDVFKVFVPFTAMQRDFPNKPPSVPHSIDELLVAPRSEEEHEDCKWQIRRGLARIYHFDPHDKEAVPIWDTIENLKKFSQLTDGMKYFLGAVGVVTLFLGGIGVMNVMMVAVRERTREIGIRKAVGATSRSILYLFFMEALCIVFVSGAVAFTIAYGICALVNKLPMPPFFAGLLPTWQTTALSLGLLGVVAIGSALYPASRAAEIDPIEALRFEAGG